MDIINWSMNSITTKVVIRFKTRLSIQGYQESSISAALSERHSRLAEIEPSNYDVKQCKGNEELAFCGACGGAAGVMVTECSNC